jgi:hypothetical protein
MNDASHVPDEEFVLHDPDEEELFQLYDNSKKLSISFLAHQHASWNHTLPHQEATCLW